MHVAVVPGFGIRIGQSGGFGLERVVEPVVVVVRIGRVAGDYLAQQHAHGALGRALDRVRVAVHVHVGHKRIGAGLQVGPQELPEQVVAHGGGIADHALDRQPGRRRAGIRPRERQVVVRGHHAHHHAVRADLQDAAGGDFAFEVRAGADHRRGVGRHRHGTGQIVGGRRHRRGEARRIREGDPDRPRVRTGLDGDAVLALLGRRARDVGQHDLVLVAVEVELGRIDDQDRRAAGTRRHPHAAVGVERDAAPARVGVHDGNQMLVVRIVVVQVRQGERQLVVARFPPAEPQGGAVLRHPVQGDQEAAPERRLVDAVPQRAAELDLHVVAFGNRVAVLLRPGHVHAVVRPIGVHGTLESREMPRGVGQQRIGGRRDFRQLDADRCHVGGRHVDVVEAPFQGIVAVDQDAGIDALGFDPSHLSAGIVAVAVGGTGGGVVVAGVGVGEVVPNALDGRIRAHHHAVAVIVEGLGVDRILHFARRRRGVVVERLVEGVEDRRALAVAFGRAVALQERPRRDQVEALHQARRDHPVIVVRTEDGGGRVEVRNLPGAHHFQLAGNVGPAVWEDHVPIIGAVDPLLPHRGDLVLDLRAGRQTGDDVFAPPIVGLRSIHPVGLPIQFDDFRASNTHAAGPLRPGPIRRVVEVEFVDVKLVPCLHPEIDVFIRGVFRRRPELRRPMVGIRGRVVIDKCCSIGGIPIVRRFRFPDGESGRPHGEFVDLGAGGADLVAVNIHRPELLRPDAAVEIGLLVAEIGVGGVSARGMVARIAEEIGGSVERHAAVELEQDVVGRAVDVREERHVRRRCHARHGAEVVVGLRRRAGWIAAVGQAVGIEFGIAVGPVPALVGNRVGLLAVGIDLDRLAPAPLPELRLLGAAPGKREIARRRHRDLDLAIRHLGVELPAAVGVLPQDRAVRKRRVGLAIPARVPVPVHHEHQGRRVAVGHVPIFALVAPFVGQHVVVAPAPELAAARERVVNAQQVGNAQVAELPERPRVGVARERAAAFAERFGLPVAVGIDVRQAFARQVDRVVQVLVEGHGIVVALGVVHAQRLAELDVLDVVGGLQQAEIPPR